MNRNRIIALALLYASVGGACLEAETTTCAWGGVCPPGMSCYDLEEVCVFPSQLETCRGEPNQAPCDILENPSLPAWCRYGVCVVSFCGDGLVDDRAHVGEACDDGNIEDGDGCRADCRGEEICGDGYLDEANGEECDDGNIENDAVCLSDCREPFCGDNVRTGGEECDDGEDNNDTRTDACRTNCRTPACGDGVMDSLDRGTCWSIRAEGRQDTGAFPVRLATGRLRSGGALVVAVAAADASQVTLLRAEGPGGLVARPPLALAARPTGLAFGDVDRDDATDLVVVDTAGQVWWFRGDGLGELGTPTRFTAAGAAFTDVAVVDLAGDGDPRILATDEDGDALWVLSATGATLTLEATYLVGATGYHPFRLAAGDLDHDGRAEIVVANRGHAHLSLWSTDAAGALHMVSGFPLDVTVDWGTLMGDVAMADINGDGHGDLLWLDTQPWATSLLGVHLGDGQLVFTEAAASPIAVGVDVPAFATGDLDGDGHVDLALPSLTAQEVTILLGAPGDPLLFHAASGVSLQAAGSAIGLADADEDGWLDLLLGDRLAGYLDLYRNDP